MGAHENVHFDRFPKQSSYLGKRVCVRFWDAPPDIGGWIVRDDIEEPYLMIIRLDDGRHVLSTECQYAFVSEGSGR